MSKVHVSLAVTAIMLSGIGAAGCSSADEDGEPPVGESQDHLLAGRQVSTSEIASLLRSAGFPESAVGPMICTAKYESGFYEQASHKNTNGTTDYGLFQINSIHLHDGAGCPSTAAGLMSASSNTKCALHVYKAQGINAWYGYQKHRTECASYKAPSATSAPAPSSGSAPSDDDGTTSGTTDPYADEPTGACWSGTLEDMEPANTCVQSKFDDLWYQCHLGQWYKGGSSGTGPYGACVSRHPL